MRSYSNKLTLSKNARGIYSLDTVMGCSSGTEKDSKGCYGDCYAARYARRYGYDFSNYVKREFINDKHIKSIERKINNIPMPFVRVGTSGDPSEEWQHTIDVLEKLKGCKKDFVIITKHWNNISESDLLRLGSLNLCINTSVSALDDNEVLDNALNQYERLKPFCKSVFRIVTCDFNTYNPVGFKKAKLQDELIAITPDYIDTIFRVSKSNPLVKSNVINIKEVKFLGKKCNISKLNKKAFFGKCDKCLEQCGVNI